MNTSEIDNETKIPRLGDVLWVCRGLHHHCGIYTGNNTVIHFAPQNGYKTKETAVIHETSLEEFADSSPIEIIEFPPDKCFPPEKTVENARSRLGENEYNLFFNNCDHFSTWCKTGEQCSLQVDIVKKAAIALADKLGGENAKNITKIICKVYDIAEMSQSPEMKSFSNKIPPCFFKRKKL
jgi:hypothetical protein